MRGSTALGGFLTIGGAMILILKPLYNAGTPVQPAGVEATVPVHDYREVPPWVGFASVVSGSAMLLTGWLRQKRQD